LINNVHNSISTWKSENYHKSLLSWKETKQAEDGFSKAQKPWAKKHDEGEFENYSEKSGLTFVFDSDLSRVKLLQKGDKKESRRERNADMIVRIGGKHEEKGREEK